MDKPKPIVVYLHRYPPEIEAYQWPALPALIAELAPAYDLVYACMGPANGKRDPELRRRLRVLEQPFAVARRTGATNGSRPCAGTPAWAACWRRSARCGPR